MSKKKTSADWSDTEYSKYGGGNAGPPHRVTDKVVEALIGDGIKASQNLELTFKKAVLAGVFIGLGGVLCSSVGGDVPGLMDTNPGLQRAVFGALGFPVSIFLVTTLGAAAFTGTIVMVAAAMSACRMGWVRQCKLDPSLKAPSFKL